MSHHKQDTDHVGTDPDPEPGATWFYSLAGTICVVVFVFAVAAFFFSEQTAEFDRKIVAEPSIDVSVLRAEQEDLLGKYGTYKVAQADGSESPRIRIPIAKAMEIVIAEGRSGRPAAAAATPSATPPAAATPSATPPAAAPAGPSTQEPGKH